MSELPDNATPEAAAAYAKRRLDQGVSPYQLRIVATRIGAYTQNVAAARAILDELNRRRP